MSKPRDERQKDLFRPALDQIIDMGHPLVRLAGEIDWGFLERRFARGLRGGPRPAAAAGPADRGPVHPEAHALVVGRGAVRPLAGEPLISGLKASLFTSGCSPDDHDRGRNSDDREDLAEPYIRSGFIARAKIPHSGKRSSKRTGPIYYGGRRKPSHGFSRSQPVLVMAKLLFALSDYALTAAPPGTSPASR